MNFYRLLRPLLFRLDPERAHDLVLRLLAVADRLPVLARLAVPAAPAGRDRLAVSFLGHRYPSPLGLAAGFDKSGVAPRALAALGFGFLELGTVTPRPQAGNPRPRLFRYPDTESLENRMGFNNDGATALAARLRRRRPDIPVWVNLGKNRDTPMARCTEDYLAAATPLAELVDGFVINVSSPNTPGLRELQREDFLSALLSELRRSWALPLLVKLSPDLAPGRAAQLAAAVLAAGASGLVVSNTTTDYELLPAARRVGGLSGRVLAEASFRQLQEVAAAVPPGTPLVSVGGVDRPEEVWRRLEAGAALVEVYTALIFHGPALLRSLERGLLRELDARGLPGLAAWSPGAAARPGPSTEVNA